MDDTDDLGGVLAFQHSELLSGELKNFLWDSTDGDPYSLSGLCMPW